MVIIVKETKMKTDKEFKDLTTKELSRGYIETDDKNGFECIFCSEKFEKGLIYNSRERLVTAERAAYEQSLKVYRDLKNVTDTAFIEGYGVAKQEAHNKLVNAIKKAISLGNSIQETAEIFEISESEVEKYLNQ